MAGPPQPQSGGRGDEYHSTVIIKIVSKNNKIIGAHIVSKEASALIQQIVIAMQNNITTDKLKEVCFAHPTYSEGIMEGIMQL